MIGDLFDSPWKILIIAVVILVLFGSRKLPDAARSLGRSMHILKSEITNLHDEDTPTTTTATAAAPPAQITQQERVDNLQQQLDELRKQPPAPDAKQAHQAHQTHQAS
jgi:sec-independent protein translocase protein TatA